MFFQATGIRFPCAAQFYLGTTRLQLEHKGGADHIVTSIANVVPAFGFIGIPVIGWLLDRMGYGITLATINFLGVLASFFQAMPNVWFQVGSRFTLSRPSRPNVWFKMGSRLTHVLPNVPEALLALLTSPAGTDERVLASMQTWQ